ncbi:beta-ketoacyl synthase N-terminal-like domain-containing protein [uncultured Cellulomonas sp.]|uniref:beta-ketoacyl synthase N-terminal-like domain-containing protein n=1 Tax=uncultured Cellulomonas sp. TaxID=189682 RepID=UPI0028EC1FBB|nr:beta-ketoacyl synthase N-terminal-like domain-containing protein [uncultured Cellulomonas sp.]
MHPLLDAADGSVDAIAVVGLAARVPGADDVEEFWSNLVQGRGSIVALTREELAAAGVPAALAADPRYVPAWAPVREVESFDAELFGITARDAAGMDPQIRLFLEVAHTALEHSGHAVPWTDASVGVFATAGANRYATLNLPARSPADGVEVAFSTLNQSDYVATSLSYRLDLRGPSLTVRTACSSGLVALHLACQALRAGDCDVAVVGGADVELPWGHGYTWSEGGILSRVGTCRPFDAAADGTVFGSGAVALVLRPLADAERDGDRIHAVVRGSAVTNDGADKLSFGAPSIAGHAGAVVEAMVMAGASPAGVGYVEAHGTGTPLGDPVEVAALTHAYRTLAGDELQDGACGLGSVKGNVGHLGPVAGLVGLLKAILALDREQLPPTVGFTEPNPRLDLARTPFHVIDELTSWPRVEGSPRLAGVSSLGIGGTNAHVVLAEGPAAPASDLDHRPRLLVWSGRTAVTCDGMAERLSVHLARSGDAELADTVATLQHGRAALRVRRALVCDDARDARAGLADPARVLDAVHHPPQVRLPGLTDDEPAAFVRLRREVPTLDGHLAEWEAEHESDGSAAAWDAQTSLGARVALARTWLAFGVDPMALAADAPFERAIDIATGRVTEGQPVDAAVLGVPTRPVYHVERAHLEAVASLWVSGRDVSWADAGLRPPRRRVALPPSPYVRARFWVEREQAADVERPAVVSPVWRDVSVGLLADGADAPEPGIALALLPPDAELARTTVVALRHTGFDVVRLAHGNGFDRDRERYTARLDDPADVARVVEDLRQRGRVPDLVLHGLGLAPDAQPTGGRDGIVALAAALGALAHPPRWVTLTRDATEITGASRPASAAALTAHTALTVVVGSTWIDLDDDVPPDLLGRRLAASPGTVALRGRRTWTLAGVPVTRPGRALPLRRGTTVLVVDADGATATALAEAVAEAGSGLELVVVTAPAAATEGRLAHIADSGPRITTIAWTPTTDDLGRVSRAVAEPDAIVLVADVGGTSVEALAGAVATGHPRGADVVAAVLRREATATDGLAAAAAWRSATDIGLLARDRTVFLAAGPGSSSLGKTLLDALTGELPDLVTVT